MRVLFLLSNFTDESDPVPAELRKMLENRGDVVETLDWRSFLSDTVSQISARSRKLVRRHLQELLDNGSGLLHAHEGDHGAERAGIRRLLEISASELTGFVCEGDYDLVLCFEPAAALLLNTASRLQEFRAKTALIGTEARNWTRIQLPEIDRFLLPPVQTEEVAEQEQVYKGLKELAGNRPPEKPAAPMIQSSLRHHILKMPEAVYEASGIVINGRRIKSLVFTTDLAIIRNCDADAVFAVYPFTPQQAISEAIVKGAFVPVFCGVGGGTTKGVRTVGLARDAEAQGAMGVVLNAPISNPNLRAVAAAVDIPVVITVVNAETSIARRLEYGASIINVAGGADTAEIVEKIRSQYPDLPIIASGGNTEENIRKTIRAGANAVTYTPPSTAELFRVSMSKYRET